MNNKKAEPLLAPLAIPKILETGLQVCPAAGYGFGSITV